MTALDANFSSGALRGSMVPDVTVFNTAWLIEKDLSEYYAKMAEQTQGKAKQALTMLSNWEKEHERFFREYRDKVSDVYADRALGRVIPEGANLGACFDPGRSPLTLPSPARGEGFQIPSLDGRGKGEGDYEIPARHGAALGECHSRAVHPGVRPQGPLGFSAISAISAVNDCDSPRSAVTETILEYHGRTAYDRHRMSGHGLDWGSQPDVFKTYPGRENDLSFRIDVSADGQLVCAR